MIPYFDIPPIPLFKGAGIAIHAFGILVALAILVGSWLTHRRARMLGLQEDRVRSMIFWTVLTGFVFAHILDVVFYTEGPWDEKRWISLIDPRAGLSSMGGFFGALVGLFAWCKVNKQPVLPYADSLGFGLAFGWVLGRLGCYLAHDHPGKLASHFPLAVAYKCETPPCGFPDKFRMFTHSDITFPRHDLGFEEALCAFCIAILFLILVRFRPRTGVFVALLATLYGPVRFFLDFLRIDKHLDKIAEADPRFFGLTPAQYAAVAVTLAGIALCAYVVRNKQRSLPSS